MALPVPFNHSPTRWGEKLPSFPGTTPKDNGNPNCCGVSLAKMSAYPEEMETLFSLGQQFRALVSLPRKWVARVGHPW